jgi:hypothetical protein
MRPDSKGINPRRITKDTTIAADASASSGVTKPVNSAKMTAIMTANVLKVSAKTCCVVQEDFKLVRQMEDHNQASQTVPKSNVLYMQNTC